MSQRIKTEEKSIEDIIIERYVSELSTDQSSSKQLERSPYQLPLGHSNILSSYRTQPICNSNRSSKYRNSKSKIERSRSSDLGRTQLLTPSEASLSHTPLLVDKSDRTGSSICDNEEAQASRLAVSDFNLEHSQELQSVKEDSARRSRLSTGHRKHKQNRSMYLLTPEVYVVTAFKNGDTGTNCRISATNFERLLEECTQRLNLSSSARKLFLSSGKEVTRDMLLPRGTDVYVSIGESFKDPLKLFEKKLNIKADMQWTLSGLNLPSGREREVTKPVITSTRLEASKAVKRRFLVFPNGKGLKGIEVIADMTNTDDFLQSCTMKLKSGQQFKRILLMDGQEVGNLSSITEVSHLLNSSSAPLLGPVWLSKGESISPFGVEEYIRESIDSIKKKRMQSEKYLAQLNSVFYCDDRSSLAGDPHLTDKRILSMSTRELERKIATESEKLEEYGAFLKENRAKLEKVGPKARSELEEGSQFTMKHISALPENHRLVSDRRGIRLKVYQNGRDSEPVTVFFNVREASRGLTKDKERTRIVFQRFLDSLSANPQLASQNNKSKGILVQRVFSKSGKEITDALGLQYDDEICVSHGENWTDPFTYCLQAEISRVMVWKKGSSSFVIRSEIPQIDDSMERPSAWEATWQLPDGVAQLKLEAEEDEVDDEEETAKAPCKPPEGSVSPESCFLQSIRRRQLCLFVEPVVGVMRVPRESHATSESSRPAFPVWPKAGISQVWKIHKTGQISIKGFPHLALAVSDYEIQTQLHSAQVHGSLVQLSPFERDELQLPASQQWIFHTDGLVYSKKHPDLALTYLGGSIDELSSCSKNELYEPEASPGYRNMLAICQPLESKLAKFQRFGIRQQKLGNLGQLKKASKFNHPAWSKMAIVWPTDHKGNWIEDFDWPIEGQILTFAPPIRYKHDVEQSDRFYCLRNGERKEELGVFVTAPHLTNLKKDRQLLKHQMSTSQRHAPSMTGSDGDSTGDGGGIGFSTDNSQKVSEVAFQIFLESCTSQLGFASEARRLFDRSGTEHRSLKHLERDQVVYVSTGEDWIDPKYTKSQLEARALLAKLSDDVEKIRCFVSLKRGTCNLVLAVDSLTVGAKIGVARVSQAAAGEDQQTEPSDGSASRKHPSRESDDKLRWPWERIVSNDLDDNGAPGRRRLQSRDVDSLKQFGYEDGYIFATEDSNLVLTAVDAGGKGGLEVTLQRRRPDNVYQRWQLTSNGYIVLKYQSGSVLTVQIPKVSGSEPADADASVLMVQSQVTHQFGRAHQIFAIDENSGTIRCFASNAFDTAVTVANHCGCCTCSVVVPKDYALDQPGYIVFLPVDPRSQESRRDEARMKQCEVCVGCARSLRGRYKLQKIGLATRADFACVFSNSNALGLKETGALRLLGGKLDLTDGEDLATLKTWEKELETRRESLSLKAISERLSEARTPRPIRVLAYRNGDGRLKPPVPITGSSVQGLMDQCTLKLGTEQPVERVYLEDGTEIAEIKDLRQWRKANAKRVRMRLKELGESADDVAEEADATAPRVPNEPSTDEDLEPKLTEKYFVIGSKFAAPSAYSLGISLYSMSFLEEILPDKGIEEKPLQLAVRYSIFGQTLCTDPFMGEETFEGEKREILVKSELQILRRYFRDKFRLLKLDLISLKPEDSVLATCYVPLDSLIREEHEEFINSTKMAADFAWYRKSAKKPKGERTHASMHVEISITVSIDVDVDDDDREGTPRDSEHSEAEADLPDETLEDAPIEIWASVGEDFSPPAALPRGHRGADADAESEAPRLMRLQVYHNGDDPKSSCVTIWAETVQQALENATARLGLRRPARILYDSRGGREVRDPLTRGAENGTYCVSCGEPFLLSRRSAATHQTSAEAAAAQAAAPPPTFDTKRVLVAESSRPDAGDVTVWGDSLEALLKAASGRLKLRAPAVCFFHRREAGGRRVASFAEVSRDARLLVSTTGRPANSSLTSASSSTTGGGVL